MQRIQRIMRQFVWVLGLVGAIAALAIGHPFLSVAQSPSPASPTADPSPVTLPTTIPIKSPTTSPTASPTGSPTATPTAAPNPVPLSPPGSTPTPGTPGLPTMPMSPTIPGAPALPAPVAPTSLPPASTAAPLPTEAKAYSDPEQRFQVPLLQGYKASPIAGAMMAESPDGNLAYTVIMQSQPPGVPIGIGSGFGNMDALSEVARTVFQRGEGFQPGATQLESGGGMVMNWTGTLTIAGKPQPMGGVVLVRPSVRYIGVVLIAATKAGEDKVQGALSAIAPGLQVQ